MTDHERIWLEPDPGADPDYGRQWCQHNVWGDDATEYVHVEIVAATDAEIARLTDEVKAASFGLLLANAEIERLNAALNGGSDAP